MLVKFYNSKEWRALRDYQMSVHHYLCSPCQDEDELTIADVLDHTVPVLVDWSLRLDIKNTKPMCHDCHNKKTAEDKRKYKI